MNAMKVKSEARSEHEKNLVLQMQTGTSAQKQAAFLALYKRHSEALYFHCMKRMRGDKDEAKDVVQEVFVKVFSKIHTFNPDLAVFTTWMYRIANNYMIDQGRQRHKNVELLSYDRLSVPSGDNSDAAGSQAFQIEDKGLVDTHESYVSKERNEMVAEAIASLKNEKARKVMQMVYLEELQHEEVSKLTNLPVGTIKALVFRAKISIKEFLDSKNFEYAQ